MKNYMGHSWQLYVYPLAPCSILLSLLHLLQCCSSKIDSTIVKN